MGQKYASAKHTIAECDRCGFQYKLHDLKNLYIKAKDTHIKVCKECWEPDHPQNMQGMYPVDDPQAVRNPRPDQSFNDNSITGSRDIQWGWNPVGGARPPTDVLTPNTLVSPVVIGTFTIAIT